MVKKIFGIMLMIVGSLALVFAQTVDYVKSNAVWRSADTATLSALHEYEKRNPPLLLLPDAYALAVAGLGTDTNQYYCVSATCLESFPQVSNYGLHGIQGWTFEFSNTNGVQRRVLVDFYKGTWVEKPGSNGGRAQF